MSRNFELLRQAGWDDESFRESVLSRTEGESKAVARRASARVPLDSGIVGFVRTVFLDGRTSPPKVVLFCAVEQNLECSFACANVATLLGQETTQRVCAVDANIPVPRLHVHLDADNRPGLLDALALSKPAISFAKQLGQDNFWFLGTGQRRASKQSLSSMSGLDKQIAELRREFDFVLIDAPPLLRSRDSRVLAEMSDGVVLVADSAGTSAQVALRTKRFLRSAQICLLGIFMTQQSDGFSNFLGRLLQ
jgi:Mrp family chromosome partitioning ATPase